jgi:hypothetical protein
VRTATDGAVAWYRGDTYAGAPKVVKANLRVPGIDFYFPMGVSWALGSVPAPFLTTTDASYGPDVPTPQTRWALLTIDARQPPVLFVFDKELRLVVRGKPGDWRVASLNPDAAWVRLCLPRGLRPSQGTSASALGRAVQEVERILPDLSAKDPRLLETKVETLPGGRLVRWVYERSGVVVPPAAYLAQSVTSGVRIRTRVERLPIDLEEGPLVLTRERALELWLPIRDLPPWRAATVGPFPPTHAEGPLHGVESAVTLAFACLLANCPERTLARASGILASQSASLAWTPDRASGRLLPGSPDGSQTDLAAACALLAAAFERIPGQSPQTGLRKALRDLVDWHGWRLRASDPATSRRASALLAMALALGTDDGERALAAQIQASLLAEPSIVRVRRALGIEDKDETGTGPLRAARAWLFGGDPEPGFEPWARALSSPVRVMSRWAVDAVRTREGTDLRWAWLNGPREAVGVFVPNRLDDPAPINLAWERTTGPPWHGYQAIPESIGPCSFFIPDAALPRPAPGTPPAFRYVE